MLTPHASLETAQMKIITLAALLNGTPPRWNDQPVPISFTTGSTELAVNDTAKTVLTRADKAMYAQKRSWRPAEAPASRVFKLSGRK